MPLFHIPLVQRIVRLDIYAALETCMALDGWGFFVRYKSPDQLVPSNIRRHLWGIEYTHCIVNADSLEDACRKFATEWEGATVGGELPDSKALWINSQEPIRELPPCVLLHQNKSGRYICGEEEGRNGNGEFGMCVLERSDPPDFPCPINEFFQQPEEV